MIDEARTWNEKYPDASVSSFACRYPGQYKEAAEALRQVRREKENDDGL